jgi:hypothetical protein
MKLSQKSLRRLIREVLESDSTVMKALGLAYKGDKEGFDAHLAQMSPEELGAYDAKVEQMSKTSGAIKLPAWAKEPDPLHSSKSVPHSGPSFGDSVTNKGKPFKL